MKGTVVYKMTGSGNDFVMVDGRTSPAAQWSPERIREVCARRTGLGADGLVVLEPGSGAGAVRFTYFNNDGGRTEMCGNAALCATGLAARLEMASPDEMVLETDVGPITARVVPGTEDQAEISFPDVTGLSVPQIDLVAGEQSLHWLTAGVAHVVVVVDDIASLDPTVRGRELRSHPSLGAEGANVNFVQCTNGTWQMRTFERGIEAETQACGTGAVAAAATLAHNGVVDLPWRVQTSSRAFLEVFGERTGDAPRPLSNPRLIGQGRCVYRAVLE